jgi:antitoxin ParD1/3/4
LEEEQKFYALRSAIQEGIDSGIVEDFDPKDHLKKMKLERSQDA